MLMVLSVLGTRQSKALNFSAAVFKGFAQEAANRFSEIFRCLSQKVPTFLFSVGSVFSVKTISTFICGLNVFAEEKEWE